MIYIGHDAEGRDMIINKDKDIAHKRTTEEPDKMPTHTQRVNA